MTDKAAFILRWILGLVFAYAGARKLMEPADFATSLQTFRFIPVWSMKFAVIVFPMFELLAGILLCLRLRLRTALFAVNGMCLLFLGILAMALMKGEPVDCGCFGAGQASLARVWLALGRDVILLSMGAWLYVRELQRAG
jgi:uncharacterized membrane protein YphA (DoxX/SURF4 family)